MTSNLQEPTRPQRGGGVGERQSLLNNFTPQMDNNYNGNKNASNNNSPDTNPMVSNFKNNDEDLKL